MTEATVQWEGRCKAKFTLLLDLCSLRQFLHQSAAIANWNCICLVLLVSNHAENFEAALVPGSGELHRRKVCPLSESHRLLQPIHRRGVLQSARQWQGGGGTSLDTENIYMFQMFLTCRMRCVFEIQWYGALFHWMYWSNATVNLQCWDFCRFCKCSFATLSELPEILSNSFSVWRSLLVASYFLFFN